MEPPLARFTMERPVLHQDVAALHDHLGHAPDRPAFIRGIVHAHMVGRRRDHALDPGIEHDDVGVGSRRDGPLPRVEPEHLRGRRGHKLHEAVQVDMSGLHAAVQERESILDRRQAVRDLGEVALAQVLLSLVVEWRVVGRDHRQFPAPQPRPEVLLVVGRSQRR